MTVVGDRTQDLVAPATAPIGSDALTAVRADLASRLAPLVAPMPPGSSLVVDLPLLRRVRTRPETLAAPEEPFAWRPVFVRRSLGLAVVDACARGRFRSPVDAAAPLLDEAVARWRETGWRTFHWEPWVAGLAPGARAMVLAEAVGWASSLWSSFDWSALHPLPEIGGCDDQWMCPAVRPLRLRGRPELRLPGPSSALVSVSGGYPSEGWSQELSYLALVATLRWPTRPVPARVLGLWPDAGADRSVDVDLAALNGAADLVVAAVTAVVEAHRAVPV